jgi:5-formyltetrahydrofolate cyclo-ligase
MEKAKKDLRAAVLTRRDGLSADEVSRRSSVVEKKLLRVPEFKRARTIMFYVSKGNEVDTHGLIRDALRLGKNVVVPFCVDLHHKIVPAQIGSFSELTEGDFGILQPQKHAVREVDREKIDVFIVPGIVFDQDGHRIGWGRGFYDRFLEGAARREVPPIPRLHAGGFPRYGVKIGLAFHFQVVERVPREKHDICVDIVVTDKGISRTTSAGCSG